MARMRPELTDEQLDAFASRAEARVYIALRDQLPNDVLVIHSTTWLYRLSRGGLMEGEGDFTVFLPNSGFLAIEVKGGGISFDSTTGKWTTIDRTNTRHEIKDPFRQAQRQRHAILDQLRNHPLWGQWGGRRLTCGHAVLLPDLQSAAPITGPGRPLQIVGIRQDLENISSWISRVLLFFASAQSEDPLGTRGVSLVEKILCSSIEVRPLLSVLLGKEEETRIRLTDRQARVLRILRGRSQALIAGGAGTGKTLIALEKAKQIALEGKRAALICYNRRLADGLRYRNKDINGLEILGFHQLCERRNARAFEISGRNVLDEAQKAFAGADLFDVHLPFSLALANEIVPEKFDAVVIDEAQDFSDEYWLGVEGLLRDGQTGSLYLFFDPNQLIYKRKGKFPVDDEPFWLTENCRNTHYIHEAAYRYYNGEEIDPPKIRGAPLSMLVADTSAGQAEAISAEIGRLIGTEQLNLTDIVVLVMGRPKQSYYDLLTARRLTRGATWNVEADKPESILLETVARFKGLESLVVFLWLPPMVDEVEDREMLYVGLSRAKSRMYLVGSKLCCDSVESVT